MLVPTYPEVAEELRIVQKALEADERAETSLHLPQPASD